MRSTKSARPRPRWPMRRRVPPMLTRRSRRVSSLRSPRLRPPSTRLRSICREPKCVRRWMARSPIPIGLQVGQMAVQGVGMLSLVHNQTAWVEANFKEKDVGKMVPGQRATIEIDAYPGVGLQGARPEHRRGHWQRVRDHPCAERQRQLGQGDAARAGPDRVRRKSRQADDRRPVVRRHRLPRQIRPPTWPTLRQMSRLTRFRRASGSSSRSA